MTERTKKILFAIFFVTFSVLMGFALYWMIFGGKAPATPEPGEAEYPTGGLPTAGPGQPGVYATPTEPGALPVIPEAVQPTAPEAVSKIKLLHDGITQAVTAGTDGNGSRFYNPDDGRFYKVADDGTTVSLGDKQFFNVDTVSWANRSDQVILEFPDGSNVNYDFAAKQQVTLPTHWEEFEFSPDDNTVVAKSMGLDPDNRFLITANPNGTEAKAIEPMGDNADLAHVAQSPNGQVIAWSETGDPAGGEQQQILFVGKNRENFKSIIAPGRGFIPSWSPSGNTIMYSVRSAQSDEKPSLWVSSGDMNTLGANRRSINLNTWADKCAWASETVLYCGVPQNLPNYAGFSRNDYATLPDDVYKVDLSTGVSTRLDLPDTTHAIRTPVVNKDGSKLTFSDAVNGKLYSYDLK